jgi:hypothetical protein
MRSLDDHASATMTLEQVNYVDRDSILPIAFSLVHQVLIEDGGLLSTGGSLPQFNNDCSEKMDLTIPDHGKSKTVDEIDDATNW